MEEYKLENYKVVKEQIRRDVFCVSIVNHFRASFNGKESDKHRDKKYERFCYWRKLRYNVVVEAILKNGLRTRNIVYQFRILFNR
ncbi:MAG: hypothetical protein IH950_16935 [Bacteroidetes bacterium]|nr:hypothetical protein [Bacteroidota bacterium]